MPSRRAGEMPAPRTSVIFPLAVGAMVIFGLLAAAAATVPTQDRPAAASGNSWDSYQIVITRNIFSKSRTALEMPTQARHTNDGRSAAPKAEDCLTLTGVVERGGVCVAFLEDSRTGETNLVTVGGAIADGVLRSVSFDQVEYVSSTRTRLVKVGQTLGDTPSTQPTTTQSTTGPATEPSSAGPAESPEDAILRKMKERLEREEKR